MKKFVSDRRTHKPNNTKSVLSIKTLMTGKHTESQRSTQVLVNEGPSLKENSLEFTTLEPTESPSFTSISYNSAADSFVGFQDNSQDDNDGQDFGDPYLAHFNHNKRRLCSSRRDHNRPVSKDNVMHTSSDPLLKDESSSSPIKVITFSNCNQEQQQVEDETSQSLSDHGNPPPTKPATTKLSSLGAFDFPLSSDKPATLSAKPPAVSISKSLGSGCFDLPSSDSKVALFETVERKEEGYAFSSPLSAIGKGLKALGTLTIPKVLQFDLTTTTTATITIAKRQTPSTPSPSESLDNNNNSSSSSSLQSGNKKMSQHHIKAEQECEYWNDIVTKLIQTYGKNHVKTAEGLLQLGHAYMLASEYAQAVVTFQSACRIWNRLERTQDDKLAFARVVDAIGMAWARVPHDDDKDHCHKAMTALEEAFQIRYELLGPWAIDTVETLNKIASVHLHLREYSEAANAYWEVFWTRRAIFGADHPSVAIAAHALGNVFVKLAATKDAANFFQIAVDIYDRMNLPNKHPAVTRLMRDYKRLDRINLTRRIPKQDRQQGHGQIERSC